MGGLGLGGGGYKLYNNRVSVVFNSLGGWDLGRGEYNLYSNRVSVVCNFLSRTSKAVAAPVHVFDYGCLICTQTLTVSLIHTPKHTI